MDSLFLLLDLIFFILLVQEAVSLGHYQLLHKEVIRKYYYIHYELVQEIENKTHL